MDVGDVKATIESVVDTPLEIRIEGADCSFTAVVISQEFEGVMPVKRQQKILSAFADKLKTGELHALTVKAHTPKEWQKIHSASLFTL